MKKLSGICVLLLPFVGQPMWSQTAPVRGLDVAQVKFNPPDPRVDLDLVNSGGAPAAAYGIVTHTAFADGSESQIYLTRDVTTLIVAQRGLPDSAVRALPDSSPLKGFGSGQHFREDAVAQTSSEHGVAVGFRAEPMFVIFTDGTSSSNGEAIAAQYMAQQRAAWKREAQAFQKWLPEIKRVFSGSSPLKFSDWAELTQGMRADGVNDGCLGEMARMPPLPESLTRETPPKPDAKTVAYLESYMKALDERKLLLATLAGTGGK